MASFFNRKRNISYKLDKMTKKAKIRAFDIFEIKY